MRFKRVDLFKKKNITEHTNALEVTYIVFLPNQHFPLRLKHFQQSYHISRKTEHKFIREKVTYSEKIRTYQYQQDLLRIWVRGPPAYQMVSVSVSVYLFLLCHISQCLDICLNSQMTYYGSIKKVSFIPDGYDINIRQQ